MAVRFVIGRAGSGKTHYCVEALVRESLANPLGPDLFWLVPEQASFLSERRLMTDPRMAGTFRVRVLGCKRLCRMLAPDLGIPIHGELTPVSRRLLLAQALRRCRESLTIFRSVSQQPGFLIPLEAMVAELVQNGQTPASLRALAEQAAREPPADTVLSQKLHDLAMILQHWEDVVRARALDGETLPGLVAEKLRSRAILTNSSIFVDSFSSMNVLEMELLAQLARQARTVTITLLADPHAAAIRNPLVGPDEMGFFYRTELFHQRLLRAFEKAGVSLEPTVALTGQHRLAAPGLVWVEQRLFADKSPPVPAENQTASAHHAPAQIPTPQETSAPAMAADPAGRPSAGQAEPIDAPAIALWSCGNPQEEVLAAARHIQRCAARGIRYRRMGLVVADLSLYEEPIHRIFSARNIPHFIDQRKSLAHHPLVELLRSAMALATGRYARAEVLALVKTGLADITPADAFAMENYMLAHGIDGDDLSQRWRWQALPADSDADPEIAQDRQADQIEAANRARATLHSGLKAWMELTGNPAHAGTASQLAAGLIALLDRLGVKKSLEAWMATALSDGKPELAQIHEQAWKQCRELLSAMRDILAAEPMDMANFGELLWMSLQTLTLGLIPPALDQVLISSAQRSRHPELQMVIVLGAIETRLPQTRPEDPMLDDRQRRLLERFAPGSVNAGGDASLLESWFFDYVAFTRASRQLVVSWPETDGAGRRTTPSAYIRRLRQIPDVSEKNLAGKRLRLPQAAAARDVVETLLDSLREASERSPWSGAADTQSHQNSLPDQRLAVLAYEWLRERRDPEIKRLIQIGWRGMKRQTIPVLRPDPAGQPADRKISLSVSQLSKFAACPLRYFFSYTLGLRERPELALEARDLGQLYHRVLERFYAGVIAELAPESLVDESSRWPNWEEKRLKQRIEAIIREESAVWQTELFAAQPEAQAKLRSLRRNLEFLLEAQRRGARENKLRPVGVEIPFGEFHSAEQAARPAERSAGIPALPALRISLTGGREAELCGKIDRIDAAAEGLAIVMDYKLAAEMVFNAVKMRTGLDLQLTSYILALRQRTPAAPTPLRPFGAFYQTLAPGWNKSHTNFSHADDKFYATCRPHGFFKNEHLDRLAPGMENGGQSAWFRARIKKDGTPSSTGHDGLPAAVFEKLLTIATDTIRRLAEDIHHGRIAPAPYRMGNETACQYCEFKSLCRFDRLYGNYRKIPPHRGRKAVDYVISTAPERE